MKCPALIAVGLALMIAACPVPLRQTASRTAPASTQAATGHAGLIAQGLDLRSYAGYVRAQLPKLSRPDFNRLSARIGAPLYWTEGELNPEHLLTTAPGTLGAFVAQGRFTSLFDALYARLVDERRLEAVRRELDAGRLTAVVTDLRQASTQDKELVRHIQRAAALIEELYAIQKGTAPLVGEVHDATSRELLRRNQSTECQAPGTRDDVFCRASMSFKKQKSDAYPADAPQDAAYCEQLRQDPNAAELMNPFAVVRNKRGARVAVPYGQVYGRRMKAIANELRAAAAVLGDDEAALKKYLLADAGSFESNNWDAADEAWAAMSSANSKWYLRLAPDEVYFDPCNSKAGFHVSFAHINRDLLQWKDKLSPLRDQMETALAARIGAPYKAREVSFALPDFIDIVLNAGDARDGLGATVGQSLPNWGPVAQRGAGRTVVMTNLYDNPDSRAVAKQKAALLLHPDDLALLNDRAMSELLDILLHEATHNFGPHSDFRINGKPPREVFGGLIASILEELKAQTGALWLTHFLYQHKLIDRALFNATRTGSVFWCFGQLSRGLNSASGRLSVYPTLAAIQVGTFMEAGALRFDADFQPSGSRDKGRFVIDENKLTAAVDALMHRVGQIKARGDKQAAEALIQKYTSPEGRAAIQLDLISERMLRFPKESFVYVIRK